MFKLLETPPKKIILIGPACSQTVAATAQTSYLWNITQVLSKGVNTEGGTCVKHSLALGYSVQLPLEGKYMYMRTRLMLKEHRLQQ